MVADFFNKQQILALLNDDEQVLQRFTAKFLRLMDESVLRLEQSVAECHWQAIVKELHFLKGMALQVCATHLAQIADQLHRLALQQDAGMLTLMPAFRDSVKQTRRVMQPIADKGAEKGAPLR